MSRPHFRNKPRLAAALAAFAVALTSVTALAFSQAAPAAAACASKSTKSVSGTLVGQDHRHLNAQISFDVKDRYGNTIDMNGCKTSAYTKTIWMNTNVSGDGAPQTSNTAYKWKLSGLPSNAVSTWIEVYTRTNTGKHCPTCDGDIDTHRYGWVNRRAVALNHSYALVAPLNCGIAGGTGGSIQGSLKSSSGKAVKFDRIYAWSELTPDGSKKLQGWGIGIQSTTGKYKISNLAAGQSYVVRATYKGHLQVRKHVMVGSCKNVPLNFKG